MQLTNTTLLPDEGLTRNDIILGVVLFVILFGVGSSVDMIVMRNVITHKVALKAAALGVCIQFLLMPVISYVLTLIFDMEKYVALGVVMTGIVPGGSTSNVFTQFSGGVLELSVFMTVVSTVLSFGTIPMNLVIYAQEAIGLETAIDWVSIVIGLVLLIVPLVCGALARRWLVEYIEILEKATGIITVIFILVAFVLFGIDYSFAFTEPNWKVWVCASIYFFFASSIGYAGSKFIFGFSPAVCRSIFMEVGLQNTILSWGLVTVSVRSDLQARNDAIQFPFVYTILMFVEAGICLVLFRKHKEHNLENDIEDCEEEFDKLKIAIKLEKDEADLERKEDHEREDIEDAEKRDEKEEEKELEKILEEEKEERERLAKKDEGIHNTAVPAS